MAEYLRVACAVPDVRVGDTKFNTNEILRLVEEAEQENADVIVFPELSITGFSCGDLFYQEALLEGAKNALNELVVATADDNALIVVGLPLEIGSRLYDCAALIYGGEVKAFVPKNFVCTYALRCFSSADDIRTNEIDFFGEQVPVGSNLVFDYKGVKIGVEIGDDLLSPLPESTLLAFGGAEVILNTAAAYESAGKRQLRRENVRIQSEKCICAYCFASAGAEESTQDFVYSGHSVISECGSVLNENEHAADSGYMIISDVDTDRIKAERRVSRQFGFAVNSYGAITDIDTVFVDDGETSGNGEFAYISRTPMIPEDENEKKQRCFDIFETQTAGLMKRMKITNGKPVIGVSGGLDSTLALLVCVNAVKKLGRDASDVIALTLPCFGTTKRTKGNAWTLMEKLGVSAKEVDIKEACTLHCRDIGHDVNKLDVTFENIQARERTQILMDIACREGGFVVGTGDLSELALGWCTYNADHMSMYGVNADIPKTLMKEIIKVIAETEDFAVCKDVLLDVVGTPISPELLPPDENGNIQQETEDIIGPYELHDFFIYYVLRYGYSPKKIYAMALTAFASDYTAETVLKWLKVFYKRFFAQQFKRSCMPDGVKVQDIGLSPRGEWNMPTDASAALWLSELEKM